MKSIFTKTLFEKRFMMLFWAIGVAAMAMLTVSFYSTFKDGSFDQILQNLPKAAQALAGNIASNKTVPGFVAQQIYSLRIPLLTLVLSIILFTGLLAGDEGEGTLQTLLAQPVSRLRVYFEKYLAGLIVSFVICLGSMIGVLLALTLIHEHISLVKLFESVIGVWLLSLVYGTVGYAIGAITGKRHIASGISALATFSTYLFSSLAASVASLHTIEKFSPFHYYNNPPIAVAGLKASNVLTMLAIITVLVVISSTVFNKRDIYQR